MAADKPNMSFISEFDKSQLKQTTTDEKQALPTKERESVYNLVVVVVCCFFARRPDVQRMWQKLLQSGVKSKPR